MDCNTQAANWFDRGRQGHYHNVLIRDRNRIPCPDEHTDKLGERQKTHLCKKWGRPAQYMITKDSLYWTKERQPRPGARLAVRSLYR